MVVGVTLLEVFLVVILVLGAVVVILMLEVEVLEIIVTGLMLLVEAEEEMVFGVCHFTHCGGVNHIVIWCYDLHVKPWAKPANQVSTSTTSTSDSITLWRNVMRYFSSKTNY